MKSQIPVKPSLLTLLAAISILTLVAIMACTSDSTEETATEETEVAVTSDDIQCPDLVKIPDAGNEPLGPPPSLPNIFTGTVYIDGEPVPSGELVYVKLITSRSHPVEIEENGKFINIIHGPVSDQDKDEPFVFCLGDPEGKAVKATETFEFKDEPFLVRDIELNFPMLPSELP